MHRTRTFRVRILLINLDGAECLCNDLRVFRRNIRGYRATPKFGRVRDRDRDQDRDRDRDQDRDRDRVRVPLKVIEFFLEHF
jgi:hypothetical protein